MSFREKSAWITVVTILLVLVMVATEVPRPWSLAPEPSRMIFYVLHRALIAFVVIEILAHIVVRVGAPRDAQAPVDERDRYNCAAEGNAPCSRLSDNRCPESRSFYNPASQTSGHKT